MVRTKAGAKKYVRALVGETNKQVMAVLTNLEAMKDEVEIEGVEWQAIDKAQILIREAQQDVLSVYAPKV